MSVTKACVRWEFPPVTANGDVPVEAALPNTFDLPLGIEGRLGAYPSKHAIEVRRSGTVSAGTLTIKGKIHLDATAQDINGGTVALTADSLTFIVDKPIAYLRLTIAAIGGGGTVRIAYLGVLS